MQSIVQRTQAPAVDDLVRSRGRKIYAVVNEVLRDHVSGHSGFIRGLSPDVSPLTDAVVDTLARGKRIRAQFCMWGAYGASGGYLVTGVPEMAAAIELFHLAALIHDDVMDRSDTRRGLPAVHRQFADDHARRGLLGDSDNHGSAAAILVGDMCMSWSDELAMTATDSLPLEVRRAVRAMWSQMRDEAYAGQYLDMLSQTEATTSRSRTDLVLRLKSAKYTVSHPLRLGGTIARADDDLLDLYDQIGVTAGAAFQLRDDLLGVFGDPVLTGKPVNDDIREGKRTLLMAEAESRVDPAQRELLVHCLGNPTVDDAELDALRSVLIATGADQAIEARIGELTAEAMQIVESLPVDALTRAAVAGLVEQCVSRTS
jgi:geranylgeranyl diphosphate synthase, type I